MFINQNMQISTWTIFVNGKKNFIRKNNKYLKSEVPT